MTAHPAWSTTEICPRPEGGGDFAPALGGGSGANRFAGEPEGRQVLLAPGQARGPAETVAPSWAGPRVKPGASVGRRGR